MDELISVWKSGFQKSLVYLTSDLNSLTKPLYVLLIYSEISKFSAVDMIPTAFLFRYNTLYEDFLTVKMKQLFERVVHQCRKYDPIFYDAKAR